jgi:hypothetical protein
VKPQSAAVLRLLRERDGITALEALQEAGCLRLAARIADLRADGFDIRSDLIVTTSGKRVSRYSLREQTELWA